MLMVGILGSFSFTGRILPARVQMKELLRMESDHAKPVSNAAHAWLVFTERGLKRRALTPIVARLGPCLFTCHAL